MATSISEQLEAKQKKEPLIVYFPTQGCKCVKCSYNTDTESRNARPVPLISCDENQKAGYEKNFAEFRGCEPLLSKELKQVIKESRKAGYYTILNSNCSLLGKREIDNLAGLGLSMIRLEL